MSKNICKMAIAGAIAAVLASMQGGTALAKDFGVLEEIIVTATKREQKIQDVPIAITAFSSEKMKEMSLKTLGDTLDFAPNVARASGPSSGGDGFFFFRGVGQVDNSINVDPGVAVYVDQIYLGRAQGSSSSLYDVERVEILRGPQGTLFGRNTVGGAVNMTMKSPGRAFGVEGEITVGDRDRTDAYLAMDAPLSANLGLRASVFTRNQDGWADSVYTGDSYGDIEEIGGRFKLDWDVADDLLISLAGDYANDEGTQLPTSLLSVNLSAGAIPAGGIIPPGAPGTPQGFPGVPAMDFPGGGPTGISFPMDFAADVDTDPFDDDIYTDAPGFSETERGGVSLVVHWDAKPVSVKSITSYRKVDQSVLTDLDGGGYHFYNTEFGTDQNQFSQEFQFAGSADSDKLRWLVGLYYFEEEVEGLTDICTGTNTAIPTGAPPPFPPVVPGPAVRGDGRCLSFFSNIALDVEAYAAFGQFDYDITDKLTALIGFRYTYEEKDQSFNTGSDNMDGGVSSFPPFIAPPPGQFSYAVSPFAVPQLVPYQYDDSWNKFSPKLGFNYAWTENLSTYFSWSNGFKSGGFSGRATPAKPLESYDPETIESWELGFKSEWLNNSLRFNGAAFFSEYDDVQLLVLDTAVAGNAQFITQNGGTNEITGVELELMAQPIPPLFLSAGLGWIDTDWTKLAPGVVEKGDPLPNTPEWTFNFAAQYNFNLGDSGELVLRGDYSFADESSFQTEADPGEIRDSREIVNLRLTYHSPNDRYSISLYGVNVFDEEYYLTLNDTSSDLGVTTGVPAPRTEWGIALHFKM